MAMVSALRVVVAVAPFHLRGTLCGAFTRHLMCEIGVVNATDGGNKLSQDYWVGHMMDAKMT